MYFLISSYSFLLKRASGVLLSYFGCD